MEINFFVPKDKKINQSISIFGQFFLLLEPFVKSSTVLVEKWPLMEFITVPISIYFFVQAVHVAIDDFPDYDSHSGQINESIPNG